MKTKEVTILIVCVVLAACSMTAGKDVIKSFIPGTYVMAASDEISKVKDTLRISKLAEEGNSYIIIRNTSYRRIINKKILPTQHKSLKWIGLYDDQQKVMRETSTGKVFTFIPEKEVVLVGTAVFKKLIKH
jgi:hypothetical protein